MTFDDYLGKECLLFLANASVWDGANPAKVKIVGAEPGGIWIEWEELTKKLGSEALQEMRGTDQCAAFFVPFSEIRLVFCPRLKLAEDGS